MLPVATTRITKILEDAGISFEILYIDDGSRDESWKVICTLAEHNPHVRGLSLSRNFGKEAAICAGLDRAQGDCCLVMDCDLQHPPEYIPDMVRSWREEDYDVVRGVKRERQSESALNRAFARTFYRMLHALGGVDLQDASDFVLMDRKVVDAWKQLPERQPFFRAMSDWVGFHKKEFEFDVADRTIGESHWSFKQLANLAVHSLTAYSYVPLQLSTMLGGGLGVLSVILVLIALIRQISGLYCGTFWIGALVSFGFACVLVCMGILGIYAGKTYEEAKGRPRYLIGRAVNIKENR